MRFRCYGHRTGGHWHAICTDLDIAVDGRSYQEVKASLETCTLMYLESIVELPQDERQRFLARRSPWSIRARMAVSTWANQLLRGKVEDRPRSFFVESHVPPPQYTQTGTPDPKRPPGT